MSRLAVLSDLHGNLSALAAVEADMARRGVEHVLVLGDLVGYLARPNQVAARVAARGWPALAGNYDQAVLTGGEEGIRRFLKPGIGPLPRRVFHWTCRRVTRRTRSFLGTLPSFLRLDLEGVGILALHGSPKGVRDYVYPDRPTPELEAWRAEAGVHLLLMGHTHLPFVRRLPGGLALNPGSVGVPKDGDPRAAYALVDLDTLQARVVRVEFDWREETRLMLQRGLPREAGERLLTGGEPGEARPGNEPERQHRDTPPTWGADSGGQ